MHVHTSVCASAYPGSLENFRLRGLFASRMICLKVNWHILDSGVQLGLSEKLILLYKQQTKSVVPIIISERSFKVIEKTLKSYFKEQSKSFVINSAENHNVTASIEQNMLIFRRGTDFVNLSAKQVVKLCHMIHYYLISQCFSHDRFYLHTYVAKVSKFDREDYIIMQNAPIGEIGKVFFQTGDKNIWDFEKCVRKNCNALSLIIFAYHMETI